MTQLTAQWLGDLLFCRSASPTTRTLFQILILLAGGRHSLLLAGGRHALLLVSGVALSPSVPTAASILAGPSVGSSIVGLLALFSWET